MRTGKTIRTGLTLALLLLLPAAARGAAMPAGNYEGRFTGGTVRIGSYAPPLPLPAASAPSTLTVPPGAASSVVWPLGSFALPPLGPIHVPVGAAGAYDVTVAPVLPDSVSVLLDPATGAGSTHLLAYSTLTGTWTPTGGSAEPFTCQFGSAANPIVLDPTTANGSAWDPASHAIKLVDNAFAVPPPSCTPTGYEGILGDTRAGSNSIELTGQLLPPPPAAPAAGAAQPGGSGQPVSPQCIVPMVTGMKLATAKTALKRANCRAGKITKRKSTRPVGTVLKQKPKPATALPTSGKVALVIAKRPKRPKR